MADTLTHSSTMPDLTHQKSTTHRKPPMRLATYIRPLTNHAQALFWTPLVIAALIFPVALGMLFGSYNPDTIGLWFADYGLELSGPAGIELVHCATHVGPFTGVDC